MFMEWRQNVNLWWNSKDKHANFLSGYICVWKVGSVEHLTIPYV